MTTLRVELPDFIARDLLAEGHAVRPISTRGSALVDMVQVGVDAINAGSAVVSIVAGVATCRRIAGRLRSRSKELDGDLVILSLTRAGRAERLELKKSDPDFDDKCVEFLLAGMAEH